MLTDDRSFFPSHNGAVTVRSGLLPSTRRSSGRSSAKIANAEIIAMGYQVDVDGRDWADVAKDWMVKEGFVTAPRA